MLRIAVIGRFLVVLAVVVAGASPALAGDSEPQIVLADWSDDVVLVEGEPIEGSLGLQATDPLGLVTGLDVTTAYTLSSDSFDVWSCGSSASATELVDRLDDEVGDYYDYHSRGRYRPVFTARGDAGSADPTTCAQTAADNVSAGAEAAMVVLQDGGGVAYNVHCGTQLCSGWQSFPSNNRVAFVGETVFSTTAAHEIGHLIQWPHSYTGTSGSEYDNAMDLMSGNYGRSGNQIGSYQLPYEPAVIHQYAAGWVDPSEVWTVDPAGSTVVLSPAHSGFQMAVMWDGSSYYTFAARAPEEFDPIGSAWSGVEVYRVTQCTDDECLPGFRRVVPEPAIPFEWSDPNSYDAPPAHVIPAGGDATVAGVSVSVSASGSNFAVQFGSGADPGPGGSGPGPGGSGSGSVGSFSDDDGSVFENDIEWLAESGITAGCNPPANTLFCPDDPVTRGAMAAFLHRALPDLDDSGPVPGFGDTAGSVFVDDIDWLAATGVTRGCNPPANNLFCPDDSVTRGAMAAFLVRALGLTASSSIDFADDNSSVFEADIEKLATAGITLGCNPPTNDRFCPDDPVTRGAMAAFLRRALG